MTRLSRNAFTTFGTVVFLAGAWTVQADQLIWDNGDWNPDIPEANGYSHWLIGNLDRRVLSDFTLKEGVVLTTFIMDGLWGNSKISFGTDIRLWLRADNGGTPGDVIREFGTTGYWEFDTGGMAFNRDISTSQVKINSGGHVTAGTYWLEMQIQGMEPYFQLSSFGADDLLGEQTWLNYSDYGGQIPADGQFGVKAEVNWKLYGVIPSPAALAIFALTGWCVRRRCRD